MKTTCHILLLGILSLGKSEPLPAEQISPQITPESLAPKNAPEQHHPPQQRGHERLASIENHYKRLQQWSRDGQWSRNGVEVNAPEDSQGFDQAAQLGDFPYKVQIRKGEDFIGGGTLVRSPVTGNQIVLTAAHIVTEEGKNNRSVAQALNSDQLTLRMGILHKDDITGQERRAIRNFIHPGYIHWKEKDRPIFNDIAILVPDRPFELNDHVNTLALPISDGPEASEAVTVKGWGIGREGGHTLLRSFEVPVWDSYHCDAIYYKESGLDLITSKHFCAGFVEGRNDKCLGDNGAAAMGTRDGVPYIAGIVSWGKGCGTPGYPGVLTKVSAQMDWIKEVMYLYEKFGYI